LARLIMQIMHYLIKYSMYLHFNYALIYKDCLNKFGKKKDFWGFLPTLPLIENISCFFMVA